MQKTSEQSEENSFSHAKFWGGFMNKWTQTHTHTQTYIYERSSQIANCKALIWTLMCKKNLFSTYLTYLQFFSFNNPLWNCIIFAREEIFPIRLAYLIIIHCCNALILKQNTFIYFVNYRPAPVVKSSIVDVWRSHDYTSDLF